MNKSKIIAKIVPTIAAAAKMIFFNFDSSNFITISISVNAISTASERSLIIALKNAKMKNNMPTQDIFDLLIHSRENDLVVGTYGRGLYVTDISPLQEINEEVLAKDDTELGMGFLLGTMNDTKK